MSLARKDLRKTWKFEFIEEAGIDAGVLARKWFQLVTEEIFNPDNGLWQPSAVNQMCMDINPVSALSHPDDHLVYLRFLGRVLAKALCDQTKCLEE
jgi:E3 ubiquitin-protein ligase NEDD4